MQAGDQATNSRLEESSSRPVAQTNRCLSTSSAVDAQWYGAIVTVTVFTAIVHAAVTAWC